MTDPADEGRPGTADDVIRSIIRTTADNLIATLPAAIEDAPDGVHQHRTHVRRLRSVLAALRDHLDEAAVRDLRVQFREWGQQLGVVRDFEVQAEVAASASSSKSVPKSSGTAACSASAT